MTYAREVGKAWHVLKPSHSNYARCGVGFDPKWHPDKVVERSDLTPPQEPRCTRKGCREGFGET